MPDTNHNLSVQLYYSLPEEQRKEVITVENECDLEPCFMGFVETYYYLSKLIPKDWTVVDIGSAYAPQCYYFQDHAKYIAVEPPSRIKLFHMDNTEIYRMTAKQFINDMLPKLHLDMDKTFAICSYVPEWYNENPRGLTRRVFKNLYCFYPSPRTGDIDND